VAKSALCLLIVLMAVFSTSAIVAEEKLRDPTAPLNYVPKAVQASRLDLQAVYKRDDRLLAIVNGQLVKRGDVIQGATIIAIHDKSLEYKRNGVRQTLKLRPSVMKKFR